MKCRFILILFLFLLAGTRFTVSAQTPADATGQIEGAVKDRQGFPVNGAKVTATQESGNQQKTTQSESGKFKLEGLAPAIYEVKVEAPGFAPQTLRVDANTHGLSAPIEINLDPAGHSDEISVAATRSEQRLDSVAESVSVLNAEEIRNTPVLAADDVLRQIPSFSLFRRSSSLATHPTTQGVSLRGIGPSGGGRTLVLFDGAPFNDPFGGWVYWTRVPLLSANRIEVVDGTSSSLYGNYALGGVISVDTQEPKKRTLIVQQQFGAFSSKLPAQYDNLYTPKTDFYASDVWGKLGVSLEGSIMNSNGYPTIAAGERGPVDTKANVHYSNFNFKANYAVTSAITAYFNGGRFTENRNNAKTANTTVPGIPEVNDTRWLFGNGGVKVALKDGSNLQVTFNSNFEEFHSNFLAVPNAVTRATARQTLTQRVPVDSVGGMAQWSKAIGGRNLLTTGMDWSRVEGSTNENVYDATIGNRVILTRVAGGRQMFVGAFIQDVIAVTPRLRLTLSARLDHWKNYHAARTETDIDTTDTTLPSSAQFDDKKNTIGSPHAAAMYKISNKVSAWGGASWGFRAPTLNELYRQFSVGQLVTKANDQLGPERMFGWETGINVEPVHNLTWRTTLFDDDFTHAISNITIGTNLAQRQNVGLTHIWGIQSDMEYRLFSAWKVNSAYIYDVARVEEFDANPALIGKFLAQVPRHRGTFGVTYTNKKFVDVLSQYHYTSAQYDDDVNTPAKRLGGYGSVDFGVSRQVHENFDLFFNMQNIFNKEFVVQTGPRTIGAPRLITAGLRIHL